MNTDGTWTRKQYNQPVHYQDAQGNWQDIDSTVVADTSDTGFSFGNKANGWRVHFAATAGGAKTMHLQLPQITLAETLDNAAQVSAAISGAQIVYPDVFNGVDLRYGVGATHIEELLLLHTAQIPASYSFTYHIQGVSAHQDPAGNILFTDAQGTVEFAVGGVQMYEADTQGQPLPTAAGSSAITISLAGTAPDFTVTLTPDQTWLTNPARHFPVAIDPSYSGTDSYQNTSNGNIYGDTFVESGNPTWSFYTTNSERIGNCNALPSGALGYGTGTNRSYLKFPIDPAPASARVTSATLSLYQTTSYAGATVINASEIKPAWNETTLTWNTQPSPVWGKGSGTTSTGYNTWISIDVTAAVYDWWEYNQANNGLLLSYANEAVACDLFASDDYGSNLPTLTVNYAQDVTAPTGGLTINGGATYTNTPTVTLTPTGFGDSGALTTWSSKWTTVNGVGSNGALNANWSVDSTHTQLVADTSSCGGAQCFAQTFFSSTIASSMSMWPTYTAMFNTDSVTGLHFGVVGSGNNNTRINLAATGSTGFSIIEVSFGAGSYSTGNISVPLSANTWYYGQVAFPLPSVVEFYIWPMGQARPTVPTAAWTGVYMANPGLNFWEYGDNGANLHHLTIANVIATTKDPNSGATGFGVQEMSVSNDNVTFACPAPASGVWCVAAQQPAVWTMSMGDGRKPVYIQYRDNAGYGSAVTGAFITLDTTGPTASITSPSPQRELRGIVTVTASATDPTAPDGTSSGVASVSLYLDGQQIGSPVQSASTATFLWDTTNVAPGEHTLTARATDVAGNTGPASPGVSVVVSNAGQMPYETFAKRDLPDGESSVAVNTANGNAVVEHQDLDVPGLGPDLALGRSYNALTPSNGLFGWGWTSDLDERVSANGDGSLTYTDPEGGAHVFFPNGSGGYVASPGLYLSIIKNGDGTYTLTAHDQTKTNFNASGQITGVVDRNGNALTIAYSGGTPTSVTDAAGRQLTVSVSGGHVTGIAAPGSRSYGYTYDGSGNLTDYLDPASVDTHYTYDSGHRLTSAVLNYQSGVGADQQTNVATSLTYDSRNRLVQIVDPMGYNVVVVYGPDGSGLVGVDQLQNGAASQTPSCTNGTYECTSYTATTDGSGAIAQIIDPLLNATTYNGSMQLTRVQDPDSNVSTSTYDANGNELTHIVDPGSSPHLNLQTTWTYDTANNALTETDPRGVVMQYTYDSPTTGNAMSVVRGYVNGGTPSADTNVTTTYTYDSHGEVLTATDPYGVVTKYTYDSQGDTLSTTENYKSGMPADSQTNVTTSATYDVLGEKLTATNALGIVNQDTYDIRGNLMQSVENYVSGQPSDFQTNVTTGYFYDALGRTFTKTNPRGIVSETVYDADGRVTKSIANCVDVTQGSHLCDVPANSTTNVVTTTQYDEAGNATVATDAKSNTTTTTYDADNRATDVTQKDSHSAVVQETQSSYDADGNTLTSTVIKSGSNQVTTSIYDAAGRTSSVAVPPTNPGAGDQSGQSNVTASTYDADGNVTDSKVTNSALSSPVSDTTGVFDKLGHQTSKTEQSGTSDAQTTAYTYDLSGRQVTTTDPSNKTTTTAYDALGQVTSVTHPDNSVDTTTYDAGGEQLSQANSAGTTNDTYDPLGRTASETRTVGGTQQTIVSYSYDADGNVLTKNTSYAGGTATSVITTYDALDRQTTMNDGTRSYTYDANGNVTVMQVLNGSATATEADATYDGGNRVTALTDKIGPSGVTIENYSYVYDGAGNRTSITDGTNTTTYVYDGANQLTTVKSAGGATLVTYAYDANHNRTNMVTSAGTTNYTYDTADTELTQKTDPSGKVTAYVYDTNGNLTSATYDPTGTSQQTVYKYDANNRLNEVDKPDGSVVTFSYDADGNRTSKSLTASGATTTVNDVYQNGRLAYQTDGSGTLLATFTYDDNGTPTSVQVGSNPQTAPRYYYVYNGHGDVVNLADANGNVMASYSYDEYGVPTSSSESFPGGWSNPYRYDGRDLVRYDPETALNWMSVRAYDPTLGRFIARDPLGRVPLMGWTNQPYAYAGNNPLVNVDPSGQRFFSEGLTVAQQSQAVRQTQRVARIQRVVPHVFGCKGTMTQCSRWANERASWITEQGKTLGILQMGLGAIDMAQGLYGLFQKGGNHLSVLDKVGKFLDIMSGFVSILGGLSTYLSATGVDTSFLDVITNFLGAGISAVSALYHLVKRGLGWLFEGGLSAAWSVVTYMFTSFNLAGVIVLLVSLVFHATFEDGLEAARDLLTAWLDWRQGNIAQARLDTIDQFCRANYGVCAGY